MAASEPSTNNTKAKFFDPFVQSITPSRSNESERTLSQTVQHIPKPPPLPTKVCYIHPKEELVSVCTMGKCPRRGAMCPQCQVRDHTDHLERTWNLSDFLYQIEKQVQELQPGTLELNDFLIDFKRDIDNKRVIIIDTIERISQLVNQMITKAKTSFDKDIDDIKINLNSIGKCRVREDFATRMSRLTQYFGIDPQTRKVFRKNSYGKLYKWKTTDLLMEQKDFFNSQIQKVLQELNEVASKFSSFQIPEIDIVEVPHFTAGNLKVTQSIQMAHQNWIRSVQFFRLSDKEVENLKLLNLAQMGRRDHYTEGEGLFAIVTNSDDMDIKIWVYSPEDQKFHNVSQISQAHSRECLSMRVQHCDCETLNRMNGGVTLCSNLIFTSEHGLIKIWDWISHKCINEIKTYSIYTYDFEILRFPELGLCYAKGSKNILQITDFTSPGGIKIQEIYPEEQHKEITCFQKIAVDKVDLLVVSFGSGTIKIYNHSGKCITKIFRQEKELAFCLEQVRSFKRSQNDKIRDIIVVGSDLGTVTAYTVPDGKALWANGNIHTSWVRGLSSVVVKDSYYFKSLIFSTAENELSMKMLDGLTGQLLFTFTDIFDGGLRFRSLGCLQGRLEPKLPDSSVMAAGTMQGTLYIFKIHDTN